MEVFSVEFAREVDGRWVAELIGPGVDVICYGATPQDALTQALVIADELRG